MLRQNQHQPSRGITTVMIAILFPGRRARININPVEGLQPISVRSKVLKPPRPESTSTQSRDYNLLLRGLPAQVPRARININPVEGLQLVCSSSNGRLSSPESTSTQSRDYNKMPAIAAERVRTPESTSTQSRDYNYLQLILNQN